MTLALPPDQNGRPRLAALLKHLAGLEYANLLVEGGPQLMAAFLAQDLVDEAHVFVAPILIGGQAAPHAVGGADIRSIGEAHQMRFAAIRASGRDLHVVLHRATA